MFIPKSRMLILICALLLLTEGYTAPTQAAEHAESGNQTPPPIIMKMPKDLSTLSEGETITPESMLELEPIALRTHDEQLIMELPPLGEPFAVYELATGVTTFINANFLNAGVQLPMSVLILRIPPDAKTNVPAEQGLQETVDGFIHSYQKNSRIKNLKILVNEPTIQDGHPARHLTMRANIEEADTVFDVLVISSEKGTWFIQINYDPNDKNIDNHEHYLLDSILLREDSEK